MAQIDFFYSLLSPFTYLAGDRLEQIAAKHGAEIVYRPADLMSVFAETGGVPVPKRHPFRQAYRLQELRRLSEHAGLPLTVHPKHWPTDPTHASLAVLSVAGSGGDAGAISRAFLAACWAEERDISEEATIAEIVTAHGGDAQAVVAGRDAARETYAANTALALEKGVFGAPFYVVGEEKFWGQDRLDYLDRYLAGL